MAPKRKVIPEEFVPLFVRYRRDRAIRAAGNDGELLFIRSLAHARDNETAGLIEDFDLADLACGMANPEAVAARLVECRLWVAVESGWRIRSWEKWNPMDAAAAGALGNHNRWHEARGIAQPGCAFCPQEPENIGSDRVASPPNRPDNRALTTGAVSDQLPLENIGSDRVVIATVAELELEGEGEGEGELLTSEIASDLRPPKASERDDNPTAEVVELCDHLAARVQANGHDAKVGKVWYRHCRLLIERDGRTPDQIRAAIDWATADPFWSTNIRSMQNLREKYTTLQARAASRAPHRSSAKDALAEARRRITQDNAHLLIVEGEAV